MSDIWFISDTHFYHNNILKFTDGYGNLIRPGFSDIENMNNIMRDNWNKFVKPEDKIYHLGDVSFQYGEKLDLFLSSLAGKKRLVLGNHDNLKDGVLLKHFKKVDLWRIFKEYNFVLSHIPLNRDNFRKVDFNVHGHTHQQLMPENHYINICVENWGYRPIHMDEILKVIKNRSR